MKDLLLYLIGLKQYIKQYHWLAKGYDNHILADRLEEGLDDQIDELAELLLATEETVDLRAKELLLQASDKLLPSGDTTEMSGMLESIATICGQILSICNQKQNIKDLAELAFADYLGRLSNSLVRKLYLIQIQLDK